MSYNNPFREIRALFGLRDEDKYPQDGDTEQGTETRFRDGVEFWIGPQRPFVGYKRSHHRPMARCRCGKVLSAGRLRQHQKACKS